MHRGPTKGNERPGLECQPHVSGLPTLILHFLATYKWAMDKPDGLAASGQLQNSPSFCPFCSLPGVKPVIFLITVFFDSPRKAAFTLYEGQKFSLHCHLCLPCGLVERSPQASHPVGIPAHHRALPKTSFHILP